MAYNGSGTFNRIYNWQNDAANGINIRADRMDTEMTGMATGLSTAITKDGQTTTTAQIPLTLGATFGLGSAGTPTINFAGDTDTGIYSSATNVIDVAANGSRVAGFTSTGINNTAVGATTPLTGAFTTLSASGASGFAAVNMTGDFSVATNKFTVAAASGNTGVAGTLSVTGASSLAAITASGAAIFSSTANAVGNFSVNTNKFTVDAGTGNSVAAGTMQALSYLVTGSTAPANGIYLPSANTVGLSAGGVDVFRTPNAKLVVNATADTYSSQVQIAGNGATAAMLDLDNTDAGSGSQVAQYFRRNGSITGSISHTNAATAFNTSSDKRLKENVVEITNAGAILDLVTPVHYDWKYIDGRPKGTGFLAQDLCQIVPEAVHAGDDNAELKPEDEGFQQWSVDYSKLVPYLVAEIKSLRMRFAVLEARTP